MIFWSFVLLLVISGIALYRNDRNGLAFAGTMVGTMGTLITGLVALLTIVEVASSSRCELENIEARKELLTELKDRTFNSDNVFLIREWLDNIEDVQQSIDSCYSKADTADFWGNQVSLYGLIPVYSDDTIPEHLKD